MIRNRIELRLLQCFLIIFISATTVSCMSSRVEFVTPPEHLVNRKLRFKSPVGYLVFKDSKQAKDFGFKSVRFNEQNIHHLVVSKYLAENPRKFKRVPRKSIKENMVFEVLGSYWIRKSALKREFEGEFQRIILIDENGTFSTCVLSILMTEADIL